MTNHQAGVEAGASEARNRTARGAEHQYIDRFDLRVKDEQLCGDTVVNYIYGTVREQAPALFRALTSLRFTSLLGHLNFDIPLVRLFGGVKPFIRRMGVDLSECVDDIGPLDSPRRVFERKIRFWDLRPMDDSPGAVAAPADAKMLAGSLDPATPLFLKNKFFHFEELLAIDKQQWIEAFADGDYAIFRLCPEDYHYSHSPVSGRVVDFYEIPGRCHSCNPGAVVAMATPYSKNRRVVTVIDTDVPGGTQAGLVAMIEVVALMIGDIRQCYSDHRYEHPHGISRGMMMRKGQPKSMFRPGSSVDILFFERGRVRFSGDILRNMQAPESRNRFTAAFGRPLTETRVRVRSTVAAAVRRSGEGGR